MKSTTLLYNDTVKLEFDSFRHRYTDDQGKVTSVTTALSIINKPALVNWAANMAVEYIAEQIEPGKSYDELQLDAIWEGGKRAHYQKKISAAGLGTFVHKWIERYIKGEDPEMPVNEGLQLSVNQFLEWVKKHDVKFLCSEQPIYSKKFRYTGTLDFICFIDGKMYIGDLKTTSGIYSEMWIQTSAYRKARTEEFPKEKYAGQIIIRVGKDGEFEPAVMRDDTTYRRMFVGFLAALKLHTTMETLKEFRPERE